MYLHLGDTDGLDVDGWMKQQGASITPEDVARMMQKLEQHLEDNPDDIESWAMLGRSRRALGQYAASAQAWKRVMQLAPKNADAVANYAEALGLVAQGDLNGKPNELLAQALELDPDNAKALALSGSAAFARKDYAAAIGYWEKLLVLNADDPELAEALKTGIAEAQSRLGQKSGDTASPGTKADTANPQAARSTEAAADSVAGSVTLAPALSQSVKPDDTVFIFAKPAHGPGMPLAVARVRVGELPYQFHLDDSMAMTPARKISDFKQLVVGARVSRNGSAARSSGDLEGFSEIITAGDNDVRVVIDQRVP
jgi:cytochrome c-type biogenesis protein CcmH